MAKLRRMRSHRSRGASSEATATVVLEALLLPSASKGPLGMIGRKPRLPPDWAKPSGGG